MEQVRITDMSARDLTPMQDVWHRPLRPCEMLAYKQLGEKGVISRIHATAIRSTQHPNDTQPGLDEDTRKRLEELDEYILLLERERW